MRNGIFPQGKIRVFGAIADLFRRAKPAGYSTVDSSVSQPLLTDKSATSVTYATVNGDQSDNVSVETGTASANTSNPTKSRVSVDPLYTGPVTRGRASTLGPAPVKDPGRGRADIRELVSMPGERAHKLAEAQGKAELPPKVRVVLMCTASVAFVLWIVMVAVVPDLYLGWATLLTALFVMVAHEIALKVTNTPRVVNPGDAVFRVTDVIDFGLLFMFWSVAVGPTPCQPWVPVFRP